MWRDTEWDVGEKGGGRRGMFLRSVLQLLVTADVVPGSPILSTLMMEVIRSS
jgi:hypothetical protein